MTATNVLLILADDLGFSDLGCYGGEIQTPNLDRLAERGVRLTHFYNTARCSPSRASLLTGLHPHQVGIGVLTADDTPVGYSGNLSEHCLLMPEILGHHGYDTAAIGKWHLAHDMLTPTSAWPTRRGFDHYYGTLTGGHYFYPPLLTRGEDSIDEEARDPGYYYTTAVAEEAIMWLSARRDSGNPFFLYLAFTAPHWPLHAPEQDIARYRNAYERGWDAIREQRVQRQVDLGLLDSTSSLTTRDADVPPWSEASDKEWQARRMAVYAAQVDVMDRAIGSVLDELKRHGELDDTLVVFLSDNGASAEELPPGDPDVFANRPNFRRVARDGRPVRFANTPDVVPGDEATYGSYGPEWANVSNTPYRLYKRWTHEGGIAAPVVVHWPGGALQTNATVDVPLQLVDVLPTVLDAVGVQSPGVRRGAPVPPLEGRSFLAALRGAEIERDRALYWEHCGNAAIRFGEWKLVREYDRPWELYDLSKDPTEKDDVAASHPDLVDDLAGRWQAWADRCGVIPFRRIVELYESRGLDLAAAMG